jgi:hypothetical protein
MIEIGLRKFLLADPVVKSYLNDEIFVGFKDSNSVKEFMVIQEVDYKQPVKIGRELGVKKATVQIDLYNEDLQRQHYLRTYLIALFNGRAIKETDFGLDVDLIELAGIRHDYDADDKQHHKSIDLIFHYH